MEFRFSSQLSTNGGHRANDVKYFADRNINVLMQKGGNVFMSDWKLSENQERLALTNEKVFKAKVVHALYIEHPVKLWFNPSIDPQYIEEIAAIKPDSKKRFGDLPENYVSTSKSDHAFDLVKYFYFARDYAATYFPPDKFRRLESPLLKKKHQLFFEQKNEEENDEKL